jgi:hypothetical protein
VQKAASRSLFHFFSEAIGAIENRCMTPAAKPGHTRIAPLAEQVSGKIQMKSFLGNSWNPLRRRVPDFGFVRASHGAGEGIRTHDPLITNQMLYQLSYASLKGFSPRQKRKPLPEYFRMPGTIFKGTITASDVQANSSLLHLRLPACPAILGVLS